MTTLRLNSPTCGDYALLDSGSGQKLERFGDYHLIRPEAQATWQPALPTEDWHKAHALFTLGKDGDQGKWEFRQPVPERWEMSCAGIKFWAKATPFRHVGVFPEQAPHWEWLHTLITKADRPIRMLNLFAYTGIASLFGAAAGAQVTHVDSSKPAITWARENQSLSDLTDRPIRWIVEDAVKYAEREVKRGMSYDVLLLDPPPFGRGPKGELWKFEKSLPPLLETCRHLMSQQPLCVILTAYTTQTDLPSLRAMVAAMMADHKGSLSAGAAVLTEASAGRELEPATFVRWEKA